MALARRGKGWGRRWRGAAGAVLVGCAPGAEPGGQELLDGLVQAAGRKQEWVRGKTHGEVWLPERMELRGAVPLEVPPRWAVRGAGGSHVRGWPGVVLTDPHQWWAVRLRRANGRNFNGNFGSNLRDVSFAGGGVQWGGAQVTTLENCYVRSAVHVGLHLGAGTTRTTVRGWDIEMAPTGPQNAGRRRRGTGVVIEAATCTLENVNAQMANVAARLERCHGVSWRGAQFEHCNVGLQVLRCTGVMVTGMELQTPAPGYGPLRSVGYEAPRDAVVVVVDLTGSRLCEVRGRVRKAPYRGPWRAEECTAVYWIDAAGRLRFLTNRAGRNKGEPFLLRGWGS